MAQTKGDEMQTIPFDIFQLLKKVKSNHFVIPQFQRDFTWKDGQSKLLIDSIARGYPIGSLLLLGKNYEVPLKCRPLDAKYPPTGEEEIDETIQDAEPNPDTYYILDGQQRLTSIARMFLDAHPTKNYYFDLYRMHHEFDSENANWIKSRTRGKKNPERKENNRLLRTDIALDQEKSDVYLSEYMEDSGDFPEFLGNRTLARQAAAKIKGIFENIRKYLFTFIVLDSDAPLESVCRVFETINSTGTRLTTFDLAVARYYPDPDLKELYEESRDKFPVLAEFDIDGERILEVLSMYSLTTLNKFPEATRKEKLSLTTLFINQNWTLAAEALAKAYNWVKHQGANNKTQPPHGIVVSIATTLFFYPKALERPDFTTVLKKWYFCSILAKNPLPQTNYKVCDDFKKLKDCFENQKTLLFPYVYFNSEQLIDIKHISDTRYGAIQSLMRTTASCDLLTGIPLQDQTEDHHIFPYSLWKLSGFNRNKINSVVNRIIVSKETNRNISNTNPIKYLVELIEKHKKEGNTGDLNRRFDNLFIPYDANDLSFCEKISNEKFNNFLNDRALMIIERIKEVVGDSWKDYQGVTLEDEDLEEDEYVTV